MVLYPEAKQTLLDTFPCAQNIMFPASSSWNKSQWSSQTRTSCTDYRSTRSSSREEGKPLSPKAQASTWGRRLAPCSVQAPRPSSPGTLSTWHQDGRSSWRKETKHSRVSRSLQPRRPPGRPRSPPCPRTKSAGTKRVCKTFLKACTLQGWLFSSLPPGGFYFC